MGRAEMWARRESDTHVGGLESALEDSNGMVLGGNIVETLGTTV